MSTKFYPFESANSTTIFRTIKTAKLPTHRISYQPAHFAAYDASLLTPDYSAVKTTYMQTNHSAYSTTNKTTIHTTFRSTNFSTNSAADS